MRACNCARASPFQSRTCVGCDLVILYQRDVLPVVSIHAPAWGATPLPRPSACRAKSFKPRTRVGCDQFIRQPRRAIAKFQSTHPRGVRPSECRHDGGRQNVSIHAPAWGATNLSGSQDGRLRSFNPRTRVGCDHPNATLQRLNCHTSLPQLPHFSAVIATPQHSKYHTSRLIGCGIGDDEVWHSKAVSEVHICGRNFEIVRGALPYTVYTCLVHRKHVSGRSHAPDYLRAG